MSDASRWPGRPAYGRWAALSRVRGRQAPAPVARAGRQRLAAWFVVGLNLLAVGVIAADLAGFDTPDPVPALPIWLAVGAFTLVELAVVRLEIGGQPVVIALRATPVLASLTYLSPAEVVAAHVIGTSIALLARNRPSPSVTAVVVACNALGTAMAAMVFGALLPTWSGTAAGWWLAGSAAMVVANTAWTVGAVKRWSLPGRPRRPGSFVAALACGSVASVVDTSLAITVVIFLRTDPSELLLLAGPALLSLAAYRAWAGLRRRHARVEFLYACARLLEGPSSGAAMFDALLGLTRDIVGADRAVLLLHEPGDRRLGASVGPGTARRLLTVAAADPLVGSGSLPGDRPAILVRRGSPVPGGELAVGATDAIIVRIDGGAGASGTLAVTGRRDGSSFTREDVRVLESVAVSVGATLGSRRMTEELRASLADLARLTAMTSATGGSLAARGEDVADSAIAVGIIDAEFTWEWVNDAFCRLLGAEADDLLGRRFEVLLVRDDIEPAHGLVSRMLRGESRGSAVEIRLQRQETCEPIVVSFFVRPLHADGAIPRAMCMLEDVTAVRQAEARAERIERRAQEAILELTATRQPEEVLGALSDAARDVTEADVAAVQRRDPEDGSLLPLGDVEREALRSILGEPGHPSLRVPVPHADGAFLLLLRHAGARPFSAADAAVARRLADQAGVSLDNARAHQRALELVRELDSANAALQQASAARSRFLANVSHELRTPLHAILLTAQLMADPSVATRDPDRARSLPSTVERTGRHLLGLIEDLVDLSRMELHDLRIDLVPMDLELAVQDAVAQVGPLADARGIALSFAGATGISVRGDPKRLRQVLINLLANAVKYTPRGGRVRVAVERDREGLHLGVLDTGIGIDPSDLERAFEPFERLAGTATPGAGLGLPIARRIMELHGGRLTATSVPGLGSVFTAHLPVDAVLAPAPVRETDPATTRAIA